MKRQPPPRPQDDEKTLMVGRRDWRGSPQDAPAQPADESKTMYVSGVHDTPEDEGKTRFVAPGGQQEDHAATTPMRPAPSPRLPWPARDQHAFAQPVKPEEAETHPVVQPHLKGRTVDDDRTRLFNPAAVAEQVAAAGAPAAAPAPAKQVHSDDPVVGWLVVVDGPGKGRSIEIGIGANALGRDASQKLRLDFGDPHISREKHAVLVFDPRSRRFFLQGGDVRNLTYIGEELVLAPTELKGAETILIGQTSLRFVPLCGPDFGWT